MGMYEIERKLHEQVLKLYEQGALDARISIKTDWTNENVRKIADILAKAKIDNWQIAKTILHPTKDIGPAKHEKHISVWMVGSPFKVDELIKEMQKLGEAEIDRLQCGVRLFKGWEGSTVTYLIKEEEP